MPNGVISDYTYDSLNRLTQLREYDDTNDNHVYDPGVDTLLSEYDYDLLANGNRSGVTEETLVDGVLEQTRIDWAYDSLGRLTSESYQGYDSSQSYIDRYSYDLVGNRLEEDAAHSPSSAAFAAFAADGTLTPDETITYAYDANDRLLTEADDKGGTGDTFTVYGYGTNNSATQQTSKVVHQGLDDTGTVVEQETYSYNLQGQMSQTIVDPDGSGLDDVKYDYTYDADGIRVSQTVTTDTDHDGSFADETPVTTQYLNDTNNPTGCSQVLEERDITGVTIKTYKIGLTVDTQQSSAIYNGGALFLLKDGHGSTRMLVDATGQVVNSGSLQIFRYDAFGNRLDTATALTTLLYSGEQTDATGLQYLRARYYNPNTGRFNSLDPYHGNISDPLSLHKYLYCHGDGINYTDPTGRFEGLAGMLTSISDAIAIDVLDIGASMVARKFAFAVGTVAANWVTVASAAANILMHPLADGLIVNFNWGQSNAGLGVATTLSLYFSRLKVYVYWSGEFGFAPLSACANPIHSGANWGVNAGFVWNAPSPNALSGPSLVATIPYVMWSHLSLADPTLPYYRALNSLIAILAKYNIGENISPYSGSVQITQSLSGPPASAASICFGGRGYAWGGTISLTSPPLFPALNLLGLASYLASNLPFVPSGVLDWINQFTLIYQDNAGAFFGS